MAQNPYDQFTENKSNPYDQFDPGIAGQALRAFGKSGPLAPAVAIAKHTLSGINELSDIAGSGITEGLSRIGASPEMAAGAGTATNLAAGSVIAGGAGKIAAQTGPLSERLATRLIQSAVKPNAETLKSGEFAAAAKTMLQQGIRGTQRAMEKVDERVSNLETKIQGILDESPAKIDPLHAADNIKTAIADVSLNLDQARNLRDIEKVYDKFINHPAIKDMGEIPVAVANKMKQAFYRELKEKSYTPGADLTASAKGQKAITSGIRQDIAAAEPNVVPSLKDQSELLNVLKVAGPQAAREGNKNLIGLGALSPRLENVLIWMVDRYPWFKSALAEGLYSGRVQQGIVGTGTATEEAITQRQK